MPPGGIRTHDASKRSAADLRLRQRGHCDRLTGFATSEFHENSSVNFSDAFFRKRHEPRALLFSTDNQLFFPAQLRQFLPNILMSIEHQRLRGLRLLLPIERSTYNQVQEKTIHKQFLCGTWSGRTYSIPGDDSLPTSWPAICSLVFC
jgi:hypothetical protein